MDRNGSCRVISKSACVEKGISYNVYKPRPRNRRTEYCYVCNGNDSFAELETRADRAREKVSNMLEKVALPEQWVTTIHVARLSIALAIETVNAAEDRKKWIYY